MTPLRSAGANAYTSGMIVGIDLGTTNSLVSVWRNGASQLVPNALGRFLTPSVVSLDRFGEMLVGEPARERLETHPDRTAATFKRSMGTGRVTVLDGRPFRPEELSSFVLRALKADAESLLGEMVTEAVITVPAYFSDAQRKATRIAGELAELKVERVLNEPTAAALAYGLHEHRDGREGKILVFDLGGGTFDVSVVELFDGVMEVRATAGDNFLGGQDFDTAVMAWFAETAGVPLPDAYDPDPATQLFAARLRRAAEAARVALTQSASTAMELEVRGRPVRAVLDADHFATLAQPLHDRLRQPVARALSDSRIRPEELSAVVLAGGATRMPAVRRLVATMLGQIPLQTLDPDQVVALGAGAQAGLKMRDQALDDVVLTDVVPYTLGMEVVESLGAAGVSSGRLLPVIERNTVVPVSRTKVVMPVDDFQRRVVVRVYQGESRLVKDNIPLGDVTLALKPRRRAEQGIEVRFTYDVNGILEVTARSVTDGVMESVVIEQHAGVLSPEAIEARLQELTLLKLSPREAAANRMLLARAERLHEEILGQARRDLAQATAAFEAALASEEPETITAAAEALTAAIETMEKGRTA